MMLVTLHMLGTALKSAVEIYLLNLFPPFGRTWPYNAVRVQMSLPHSPRRGVTKFLYLVLLSIFRELGLILFASSMFHLNSYAGDALLRREEYCNFFVDFTFCTLFLSWEFITPLLTSSSSHEACQPPSM